MSGVQQELAVRGLSIGDRVVVGSLPVGPIPRRRSDPRRKPAQGTIESICSDPPGVRIRFDHLINGLDNCLASPRELFPAEANR